MGIPISADLWERMRRLDPHCAINMVRAEAFEPRWKAVVARTWRVSISRGPGEHISIERPTLTEALEIAVRDAEWVGWPVRKRPVNLQPPISAALWERLRSLDGQRISMSIGRRPTYSMKLSKDYDRSWTCNFYRQSLGVSIELPTLTEAVTMAVEECERRGWGSRKRR